jgi:XTP/dITP diphosphohydrolase
MKIIFATNNQNKVKEIKAVVPQSLEVISLKEAGINIDIPEPHDTLQANAQEKAVVIYNLTGTACFSEDTGLEVAALGDAPGVHSARYAGEDKAFDKNIQKLLANLEGKEDRSAQFRTVICLKLADGGEHFFEGICKGTIIREQKGLEGFGYDPVFVPDGAAQTFAEMSIAEKNKFSHRRKAVDGLVSFLNGLPALNHK